jgi:hypothetical protein
MLSAATIGWPDIFSETRNAELQDRTLHGCTDGKVHDRMSLPGGVRAA